MKLDPQKVKPLEPSDYRIDLLAIPAEEISRDPELAAAAAHAAPAVESVESIVGANNDWLSIEEIGKLESFHKLSPVAAVLLLEYRKSGNRLAAVTATLGLKGEEARLAAFQFDRGSLSEAVADMKRTSVQERLLNEATKLMRSKKTTANQVSALKLLAELTGMMRAGSAIADAEKESL